MDPKDRNNIYTPQEQLLMIEVRDLARNTLCEFLPTDPEFQRLGRIFQDLAAIVGYPADVTL
jgi:hypothetical protein